MPDAPGLELIRGEIEQKHPGAVLHVEDEGIESLAHMTLDAGDSSVR